MSLLNAVLSSRGLCYRPTPCPEESYQVCVCVCVRVCMHTCEGERERERERSGASDNTLHLQ